MNKLARSMVPVSINNVDLFYSLLPVLDICVRTCI